MDMLRQHDLEASMYHDCRERQAALAAAMDQWKATAWRWYCSAVKGMGLAVKECPGD
jgi:hypothetical protein